MKQTTKLTSILSLPALDGHIATLAAAGKMTLSFAPVVGIMIAGPIALVTASQLPGTVGERAFSATIAGLCATILIVIAAMLGEVLESIVDINILQITAGFVLISIAFMLFGIKIPSFIPFVIFGIGVIIGIWIK